MNASKKLLLVLLAIAVMVGLPGCGAVAEKTVEETTGVKVDDNSGSVEVEGEDGTKMTVGTAEGELPEGLPSDVPVYDGDAVGGGVFEVPEAKTFSFNIMTKDDVKTVVDWHRSELADKGWKTDAQGNLSGDEMALIHATKGDKLDIVVTITKDESGDTSISCVVTEKK
ncbi:MAG: hypothetical protein Q8K99_14400 [Actinomycetota bacterium]|nr:hypothetical protein [Actinomycetota bacterium]